MPAGTPACEIPAPANQSRNGRVLHARSLRPPDAQHSPTCARRRYRVRAGRAAARVPRDFQVPAMLLAVAADHSFKQALLATTNRLPAFAGAFALLILPIADAACLAGRTRSGQRSATTPASGTGWGGRPTRRIRPSTPTSSSTSSGPDGDQSVPRQHPHETVWGVSDEARR
jgi:hypothetical protein